MSDIDTFDHEFVGFFGRIPIYHPLVHQQVEFSGERVDVSPNQLIIGGGSGEHPAIILLKSEDAVALFILDWLEFMKIKRPESLAQLPINSDELFDNLVDKYLVKSDRDGSIFQFPTWSPDSYHSFIERCRSEKLNYPLQDKALIYWLAESLGEFIFRSMPELIPDSHKQLLNLREHVIGGKYMNVVVPPQGYLFPVHGRRIINGKLHYGIRWKSSLFN